MSIFLTQIYRLKKIDRLIFTDAASHNVICGNFKAKRINCLLKSVNLCANNILIRLLTQIQSATSLLTKFKLLQNIEL
jgi:hypothetical protein